MSSTCSSETEDDVVVPRDTCPSQAGENRQLPLKFSKTNGFHRIFHHESIWEREGGGEGRSQSILCLSQFWGGGWGEIEGDPWPNSLKQCMLLLELILGKLSSKCEVCCKVQYNVISTKGISGQPRMSINRELVRLIYVLYMNVYISTS